MPETLTHPALSPAASRDALRIVLFGNPGAGKSSLLGALAEAAQTQKDILSGHLIDLTHGLTELRQRLYEGTQLGTTGVIVLYPVAFDPFGPKGPGSGAGRLDVVLIDSEGRVANDLLTRRLSLRPDSGDGKLAHAILDADALILTLAMEVSSYPAQVDAEFAEFGRFLRLFEQSRGHRSEVGDLPVFLVLTKCDLLVKPGDSSMTWMDRIEERKRQVGQRFQEFLARNRNGAPVPFGRLDLHLWATAVKRPALAQTPEEPRQPYQVAELFRQCLTHALHYRQRRKKSSRRLLLTLTATLGLLAIMAAFAAYLFFVHHVGFSGLEKQVEKFQARDQDPNVQARYKDVDSKIDKLAAFRKDPEFANLPEDKKEYIQGRLQELTAFRDFEKKLNDITEPREAKSLAELRKIRGRLEGLSIPEEYQDEWSQTEAGTRFARWKEEAKELEAAADKIRTDYDKLIQEGSDVLAKKAEAELPRRAKAILNQARDLPDPRTDADKPIKGSRRLTYATVFAFPEVAEVYHQWEEDVKKKLEPFAKLEMP